MTPILDERMSDDAARAAIEVAAEALFYRHGVGAVTMAQIRDESGVSLRRLYAICGSKAEVVSLWLRHRHTLWMDDFTARVTRELDGGSSVDVAIFNAIEAWMIASDFRGCAFLNTHAELSELTTEHQKIVRDHKQSVGDFLQSLLEDAAIAAASDVGAAVAVLVDGAIVQASIFSSTEPITHARRAAEVLIVVDHDLSKVDEM